MFNKIKSFFGFEKKSSSVNLNINNLSDLFFSGFSASTAFWLWHKIDFIGDAVDRIAQEIAQIKPVLKLKQTGEIIKEHKALKLLNDNSLYGSPARFKREMVTSLLLTGECYPVLIGNIDYDPSGIYQVYANNASPVEDGTGYINNITFSAKYDTNTYNKQLDLKRGMFTFVKSDRLSETIQIKTVSDDNSCRGVSPVERIYYQAMIKYYGNIHNTGLLKNAGRPSGMLAPSVPYPSKEQYEMFIKDTEEKVLGPANAGKLIIPPTPVKYENFLLNTRDMDFINLIENSRIEGYGQFKIPLPIVVTKTMTMNNYQIAVEAFYDFAVLPLASVLFSELGNFILSRYKDGIEYEMTIDEKDLSALKSRMIERSKVMASVNVFSDNEIRASAGYEEREGGDSIYKPSTYIPAGEDFYTDDNIKR